MRALAFAAGILLAGGGAARAADIAVPLAAPARVFTWTGLYVGGHLGGGWARGGSGAYNGFLFPSFIALPPAVPIITLVPGAIGTLPGAGSSSGLIAGAQIGYNWQVQQLVLGVEADLSGTGLSGGTASATRFAPPFDQTVTVTFGRINWMASFRARAGFAVDRALFYVTGGIAIAGIGGTTTTVANGAGIGIPAGSSSASTGSGTRVGWTLGGGVEWAFNDKWSVAGEYRRTDFGLRAVTFNIPDGLGGVFAQGTTNARLTIDQVTARLNYRF
jgi:outer membrane immunogenic protein